MISKKVLILTVVGCLAVSGTAGAVYYYKNRSASSMAAPTRSNRQS